MQRQDQDFLKCIALGHEVVHSHSPADGVRQGEILRCAGATVPNSYRIELMRLMVVFVDTFGRVDSAHAAIYNQYGLRRRSSAQMLRDWNKQSAATLKRLGIAIPD